MSVRLLLIRHGQTVWHAENRYAGSSDVQLDETGRRQAQALAERLAVERPVRLISSPLRRAHETALAAAGGELDVDVDDRLREVDFGAWEGCSLAEITARWPAEAAAFQRDPAAAHAVDGEDPRLAVARAMDLFGELADGDGARIAVVAHNTLLRLCLCSWLGIALADYRRRFPALHNTAITEVELTDDGARLRRLNA